MKSKKSIKRKKSTIDEKEYNVYFQRQKKKQNNRKSESIEKKNKLKKKLKPKLTFKKLEKKIKTKISKKDMLKLNKHSSKNSLNDILKSRKSKSYLKRARNIKKS